MVDVIPPFTSATPSGGEYLENAVVTLVAYTDSSKTVVDSGARIFWQRYVQSAEGIYDITDRWNLAGMNPDCIHVRFFDPDNNQVPLFTSPGECDNIAVPIANNTTALQEAYNRGDFSIMINGCDAVDDLGFTIKSLLQDNGDPIPFTDYQPGNIYVNPEIGMFMFFHFPDKWDSCSYWDFSWWDTSFIIGGAINDPPYVTDWDSTVDIPISTLGCEWDGQVSSGIGQPSWDDTDNPIPLNSYWDMVSEAPGTEASVIVCYWTQDNTNPIVDSPRSHLYTSPITISTFTQLRFRGIDISSNVENTKVETYKVGLRLSLNKGINLISEPRVLAPSEADLASIFTGLDLLQVFRIENGTWEVFIPNSGALNNFDKIDNKHGFFVIMNEPGLFCLPYGSEPTTTNLSIVDINTNQGINAIGVPRKSLGDNSITNLLDSRQIQYNSIFRVTNNIFETYVPTRASVLNFSPTNLTPGRGYGIVSSTAQTFELPFID